MRLSSPSSQQLAEAFEGRSEPCCRAATTSISTSTISTRATALLHRRRRHPNPLARAPNSATHVLTALTRRAARQRRPLQQRAQREQARLDTVARRRVDLVSRACGRGNLGAKCLRDCRPHRRPQRDQRGGGGFLRRRPRCKRTRSSSADECAWPC
eukprot:3708910-Pleurochrysis_carterae.AAC.1